MEPDTPDQEIFRPLGQQMEVYDAELLGIAEAAGRLANRALMMPRKPTDLWIFCDNQAAIRRTTSFASTPGQYAAVTINQIAENMSQSNITINICWVPGHEDVMGNEIADRLAKKATVEKQPLLFHTSLTHLKRKISQQLAIDWEASWETSKHGRSYHGFPSLRLSDFYRSQPRGNTSQMIGIRTGHGYFRSYLARIPSSKIATEDCFCGAARQTPKHLLLECKLYKQGREKMKKAGNFRRLDIPLLLHTKKGLEVVSNFLSTHRIGA
jgi:ribonuclease HI